MKYATMLAVCVATLTLSIYTFWRYWPPPSTPESYSYISDAAFEKERQEAWARAIHAGEASRIRVRGLFVGALQPECKVAGVWHAISIFFLPMPSPASNVGLVLPDEVDAVTVPGDGYFNGNGCEGVRVRVAALTSGQPEIAIELK